MTSEAPLSFEQGRQKILDAIGEPSDLTFVRGFGNIGDLLIHAGIRQLLSGLDYREVSILDMGDARGHTAVFPGAGGFCQAHHKIPAYLAELENRFEHVIVLPSSFDVSVDSVRAYLKSTRAHIFARERESYRQIENLCRTDLAHDCAFFFNFAPYRRRGRGILTACRTDSESSLSSLPSNNADISHTCETLDEFLWTIARHELIRTDRAHVMIAAAMLGKSVEYLPSNYHKLSAIAGFSLANYPVARIDQGSINTETRHASTGAPSAKVGNNQPKYNYWPQWVHLSARDIAEVVPTLCTCIFVDDCQLNELPVYNRLFLPFLERDGQHFGSPANSLEAITELERLRNAGVTYIVFAWTAFWWLDTYPDFYAHVRSHYSCRLQNERLIIFELRERNEA